MQSLLAELESGGYLGRAPRKKILKHLKVVVLDLYVLSTTPWAEFVSYSRKASSYSSGRRLEQLYLRYRVMIRAVDGLVGLGYVRSFKGFYDRERKTGYQSRMQATDKLLRLIDKNHVTLAMIERDDGPLIILRDKNKKNIGFEETAETSAMRESLASYNDFLKGFAIKIDRSEDEVDQILIRKKKTHVNFYCTAMHRVFNEDFDKGGRFYGAWWQGAPKELRCYITIDGQTTSELDYGSQHLLFLYAENQDEYRWLKGVDDDPYSLKNVATDERKLLKKIVLALVNASNRLKAIQAISKEIIDNNWDFPKDHAFINSRIDALLAKHPEIEDLAFSGKGIKLQRIDARITEYVLKHMQAKGIPVLPVHDSFITPDRFLPDLYSIMTEAYRMEGISSIPHIRLIAGADSDTSQTCFKALFLMIEKDHRMYEKEFEALEKLEGYCDSMCIRSSAGVLA